jgi:phosphoserine phosphatase RsbU/P
MVQASPNYRSGLRNEFPRSVLVTAAILFCAATSLYALAWMYDQRHPAIHVVEIGFNQSRDTFFNPKTSSMPVFSVVPGSPADKAGLRAGDEIIGLNGRALTSYELFDKVWSRSRQGDGVDIMLRRPGEARPVTIRAYFRAVAVDRPQEGTARASAQQVISFYPLFFVLVGFVVLFLRLEDSHAWLLALLFSSFVAVPGFANQAAFPEGLRIFTSTYRSFFGSLIFAFFYIFFAVFPEKSPLERRAPCLKWVALVVGTSHFAGGMPTGDSHWPEMVNRILGIARAESLRHLLTYGFIVLGLISLVWNCFSTETSQEARRKSRVLLWGTLLGVFPIAFERSFTDFSGYRPTFWINMLLTFLLLLYPLAFAYSIVKHRVLEIPVLLRNSVRYVLVQRGYFVLLICGGLLAIFLFTHFFLGYFEDKSQFGMALSAAFGVALVWVSGPFVKRGTERIDRAFFRSSYNARVILEDLVEKTRKVSERRELAKLIEHHLTQVFHPQSLAIYFGGTNGQVVATGPVVPAGLQSLPVDAVWIRDVIQGGGAWDVPPADDPDAPRDFILAPLAPECLVPLLTHHGRLAGLLALGLPRSEEPYSREDKRLLDSVASQAVIALENMRMAEQIADRLEGDRRVAHEMQIARDVQSRLFPQTMPPLRTLEYSGSCMQARQVGGDYYDFLDFGSSQRMERGATRVLDAAAWHLAFVLADISGKGIAGALLMANLQANLRSRYALALDDLPRLLSSVNQLFHENTPDDRYATLFFAVYDDHSREFEYANCGHNAPLLFRGNGSLERLTSTSTVIGLFSDWKCETRFVTLEPGDLLVIFTDGVTEANDAAGNEFGESRLIETVGANRQLAPAQLVTAIQEAVQRFSAGEQSDDLTLVIALAR